MCGEGGQSSDSAVKVIMISFFSSSLLYKESLCSDWMVTFVPPCLGHGSQRWQIKYSVNQFCRLLHLHQILEVTYQLMV